MTMIQYADDAILPLTDAEADAARGGLLHAVGIALTVYAVADIAYDFYKGFRDGASGAPN